MNRSIRECNQLKYTVFPVYFQYVEDNRSAMEGLSERAYSAHSGLSRGAVQKARKNGRLVLFGDGSINAAASDARRGVMTDPVQQMRSRGGYGAGGDSAGIGSRGVSASPNRPLVLAAAFYPSSVAERDEGDGRMGLENEIDA
jgi:hypothetical protein